MLKQNVAYIFNRFFRYYLGLILATLVLTTAFAQATPFTRTVPGTSITIPDQYPEAGGVVMVYVGVNGNIYYQFSNPTNAFRGFNSNGVPTQFRGNPFTINNPLILDCGFALCSDYFGGGIASLDIRFSALDGDTQVGGFDEDDITLVLNGFSVGNWSDITTQITNVAGTTSSGTVQGFGNNTFNTGWFNTTNQALLNNILTTGQVTTQVRDDDPNDNFWNFRLGNSLTSNEIVTVAPGYTIEKTADVSTFTAVGQTINYSYRVENIGSVPIRNLSVTDDRIANVECLDTTILDVPNGSPNPDFAICTGQYEVTQEDFDNQSVTNIANATGIPDFGVLGVLTDTLTINNATLLDPLIEVRKSTTLSAFGAAGTVVPYSFEVENTGNTTLTNVVVTDPLIPSLSCSFTSLAPTDPAQICSGNYTVLQDDVDAFATSGTQLSNTATVRGTSPTGAVVQGTDVVQLDGPVAAPSFDFDKRVTTASFDTVGQLVQYSFDVRNTGNVTFPAIPAITDSLGIAVTCPAGPLLPNQQRTCTAEYAVLQTDINAGKIDNTASATITVGGVVASESDTATVSAVRTTGLTLDKRLTTASPTSFDAENIDLFYEYELRNTGNVTLENIVVTDLVSATNTNVPVTCSPTTLLPDQTVICTSAAYPTTQDDLNAGEVVNDASATSTTVPDANAATETVDSNTDTVTVPAVQNPALELTKTAPTVAPLDFVAGNTITYTFDVRNSGNIQISDATLGVPMITITDDRIGTFNCFATPFEPNTTQGCTQDYIITAADEAAGIVVNVATANAGTVASNQDEATVAPTFNPSVSLAKSSTAATAGGAPITNVSATTDVITYTFAVTNTGDSALRISSPAAADDNPITINDPKLSNIDCSAQPASLAVGASFNCTGTYSPTQAELDAGVVDNMASASFPFTNALTGAATTITSSEAADSVDVDETLSMVFAKTPPATFTTVGETVTYNFSVQNTSNVTLTSVTVTDPLIPSLSCPITNLAPTLTATCSGDYVVTQDDIDDEVINNTASATGNSASGGQVSETDTGTTTIAPAGIDNSLSIVKTANMTAFANVGDEILYAIEVTNTGTQTLLNTVVTDSLDPLFSCTISSLAPNASNDICTYTHTVTQGDIDAGEVVNLASAANPEVTTQTSGITIPGPTRVASFVSEKTASNGYSIATNTIDFTVAVENTGNVTLTGIVVEDSSIFSPAQTCNITSLAPGVTDNTSCVFTYTVDQDDVDAGSITNTAQIDANGIDGAPLPQQEAIEVVTGPAEAPSLEVVKVNTTAPIGTYDNLPTTEDFAITVENTGNVTIENISVVDDLIGLNCTIASLAPNTTATSCSTGAMTGTYAVLQADIDNGSFENTATASGTTVRGGTPSDTGRVTLTGPAQLPALTIQKSTTFVGTFTEVGEEIGYEYIVTNSGNTTLLSAITVADDKISNVSCPVLPGGNLAPNGTITCTGTYEVTQPDIDAGLLTNIASASTTITGGPTVTSGTSTVTVNATQTDAMSLDKRLKSTSLGTYSAAGDEVTYEYVVTNTGNTTITDDITIDDDKFLADLTCTVGGADLAPGGVLICEQTYSAIQADLNAGSVTNIAQAFTGPNLAGATLTSNTDQVTVTAIQSPSMTIDKLYVPEPAGDPQDVFVEFEDLNYSFTIRNTGNISIALTPATAVVDNRITPFTCVGVPAILEPGQEHTCTGIYIVTADDIALGAVTNIAFAQGTVDLGDGPVPLVSPTDEALFPVDASPAISIEKRADVSDFDAVGDEIVYTYNVTNTGDTDLASPGTVTDDKFPGQTATCVDPSGGVFSRVSVNPTEIAVCSFAAPYSVTQEDLDAGFVTNEAFGLTSFGALAVQSPADTVTVNGDVSATLDLVKSVDPTTPAVLGQTLTYTLTATASGNQTISGVEITDPLIDVLTCTQGGATVTTADLTQNTDPLICTGTVIVTQDMIDDQEVVNTAGARGSAPDGSNVTASTENRLATVTAAPSLIVTKRIEPEPTNAGDPVFSSVDQDVTFVIEVVNNGNVTIDNITVTDDLIAGTCTIGTLAPTDSDSSCVFVKTITQTDIDNTSFVNTATASGDPRSGNLPDVSGAVTVVGPDPEPAFAVSKVANVSDYDAVGDIITYTYTISNAGNVTLTSEPVVFDDRIGTISCPALPLGGLLPTEDMQCTADYTVTQIDVDAGSVTNIVTVNSLDVSTAAEATETVDAVRTTGLTLNKVATLPAGATTASVDDVITYTYTVTNTGNTTLTDVTVQDDQTSAAGTVAVTVGGDRLLTDNGEANNSIDGGDNGTWDTLGPLDVVTFTSTYTVTQADIDLGNDLSNTATVSGAGPPGTPAPNDEITVDVPVDAADPSLEAVKTVSASTGTIAGSTITFRISVENTGNVTLDNVVLTDTLRRTDNTSITLTSGPTLVPSTDTGVVGDLEIDETWVYEATYVLTQGDIDAGGITNSVLVESTAPDGTPADDTSGNGLPGGDDSPTVFMIPSEPSILAVKTITSSTVAVGETVTFEIDVTNDGNVTLTDVDVASDTLTRSNPAADPLTLTTQPSFVTATENSPSGTLLPNETATYIASYVLVQEDIDAGGISNAATVTGTPPIGSAITDVSDNDSSAGGPDDPTALVVPSVPELSLNKQLATGQAPNFDTLDQVINYEFVVTNEGNVTLPGPFTITDAAIDDQGGTITCDVPAEPGLAPGANLSCFGSYTIEQDDLDAGVFVNTATASDGTTTSPKSEFTLPAIQNPSMELEKVAEEVASADFIEGAVATYTYTITNTGNVTLTEAIEISDNLIPFSDFNCPVFPTDGIAPLATYECTADYTVTSNDVFLTSVTNIASATSGSVTSAQTSETIPSAGMPNLSIEKTVDEAATFAEVGDPITYTFVVVNSGTQAFAADVVVNDARFDDPIVCFDFITGVSGTFNAGATATCTGVYNVTQEDLDAGEVFNEAFAQTEFSDGETPPNLTTVVSDPDNVTVTADAMPALTIVKTATPSPVTKVGETVTYSIVVTNTGNQTLNTVSVSDPLLPDLVCEDTSFVRGEVLTCSDTYIVTQDDIDEQTLVNRAVVTAQTPNGTVLEVPTEVTTDVPAAAPSVEITKTASPSTLGPVGSLVTYRFDVENTGNVSLESLNVTDVLDADFSCDIAELAPDITDNSCFFELTVTQAMIDAGELENTADVMATSSDPSGSAVEDETTITTPGPTRLPSLEATKTVDVVGTTVGQVVTYQLAVENTGNVTLDISGITDTMTRLNGTSTALDAPFELISGDDGNGRLDVGETFIYSAEHTITQSDINGGGFENTVEVTATNEAGIPVSDTSDDGDDTDGNTANDPTVVEITSAPSMVVTKAVSQTGAVAGDEVRFIISAINNGNVDITLSGVPTDTLTRADGTVLSPSTPSRLVSASDDGDDILEVGEELRWEVTYTLIQADIDAGGIENTATLSGLAPDGETPVSDVSDDGDDSDGNPNDDPTELVILPTPGIEATKTVTTTATAVGESVVYSLTVRNTGNTSLSNVGLVDSLTRADGTPLSLSAGPDFSDPASLGSPVGVLLPNEVATYSASYVLVQEDIDAGGVSNTATATGTTPAGATLSDISDDPNAAADTGPSDPAFMALIQDPVLTLDKTVVSERALFATILEATFQVRVTNNGNVTQTGIQVVDDLAAFAAPAEILTAEVAISGFTDGTANAGYTGTGSNDLLSGNPTLAPSEVGIITITTTYSTAEGGFPSPGQNTVTGSSEQLAALAPASIGIVSVDEDGDGAIDSLEGCTAADDRDGDGICDAEDYDPTGYFYCEEDGRILTGGLVTVTGNGFTQTGVGTTGTIRVLQDGTGGFYQFDVTAPGTYTISYTNPTSGIDSTSRLPITAATPVPALVDVFTGTTTTDPRLLGSSEVGGTGNLADFSVAGNPRWYTTFTIAAGDPNVFSNNIPFQACTTAGDLVASKAVLGATDVRIGDLVSYQISYDLGATGGAIANATLVDLLPVGISYVPNSAVISLNGAAGVPTEPTIAGQRLSWTGQNIPTSSILTINFNARVAANAPVGRLTNQTYAMDVSGVRLSNTATADVERVPEHVFDCSDIIGKVFDDKNHNGYQDKGEPGLPNTRVVTVKGVRITTDEHGRYHVPCAELPSDIGTNFIMKLDPRSLPSGYRVTTENPRVVRLTSGKFAKINFGAAISNVIRINLNAKAFEAGSQPKAQFKQAIQNLVKTMQETPSVVRLTYVFNDGATDQQARDRMRAVERILKSEWRKYGKYKLNIERTLKRRQ